MCRWAVSFVLIFALALGLTARAGELQALPPEPPHPNLRGLTPEQQSQAEERYRAAYATWYENLTMAQKNESYRRYDEFVKKAGQHRMDEVPMPSPNEGYTWQAAAKAFGLNPEEIERLGRDKLLIEERQYKQSFEIYIKPSQPLFITSDSLLNGFHVLFEDSFRELALRQAPDLRRHLEEILSQTRANLKKSSFPIGDLTPGWRHAQLVLGPALNLLGTPQDFFDAEVRDEIRSQVAKIREAEAIELPSWLGPPVPTLLTLDYRRCKPVGFYSDSSVLADYFRAVRWLQMIPFRADRDDELAAIAMLGYGYDRTLSRDKWAFFRNYSIILGPPNAKGLPEAGTEVGLLFQNHPARNWDASLRSTRRLLLGSTTSIEEFKRLVDDDRLPPQAGQLLPEIQYRILPGLRLPDSMLFQQIANAQLEPEGLAVAAMLGSSFARSRLTCLSLGQFDAALAASAAAQPPKDEYQPPRALYDDYLDVLRSLFATPPHDAPAFVDGIAWQAKSCQTALSGWAQMRHTFTLQASISRSYGGLTAKPPGFVEPNPAFFERLNDLAERTQDQLATAKVFLPSVFAITASLRSDADFLESLQFHLPPATNDSATRLTGSQRERYEDTLSQGSGYPNAPTEKSTPGEFQAFHRNLIAALRTEVAAYERGEKQPPSIESDLRKRWLMFERVCRRLEVLAYKQLRKEPWTPEEERFLRSYGEDLGFVMGYLGNSWLDPRDDAPRWVEVHSDPRRDQLLAVGIGRARLIHVLYPWQGTEILCQGAVMPYYEYHSKDRLNDVEWRTLLDSSQTLSMPDWIQPYLIR
jgi:hypothetical protein